MSDKLITISIAAYNKQDYIRECLDSLLVEDYIDNIEVFVIDDGGTDSTLKIAKEYEDKFPNTFKVVHKENGGYGSTVNYSIDHATGKYFKLLDGDDYFDKEGFKNLLNTLRTTDSDVIFTLFTKVFKNKSVNAINYSNCIMDKVISIKDIGMNEGIPMHAITYKTSVLRESKLRLKEHILYSDNYYVSIPFIKVNTVLFKDINVYNYKQDIDSQSVNVAISNKNKKMIEEISIDLCKFYEEHKNDDINSIDYIKTRIASTCDDYVAVLFKSHGIFKAYLNTRKFLNIIRSFSLDIYDYMGEVDRKASKLLLVIKKI